MNELAGGTAPMDDGIYLFHGPVDNPELRVIGSGSRVWLNGTVPANHVWRLDVDTWSSTVGPRSEVTFAGGGTSVISRTQHAGSMAFLDIPPFVHGQAPIEVGGQNIGPAAHVAVQGRRKYLIAG